MKITIRTKQASYQVDSRAGEYILYAGLRAGIPLPFECATGTCGTCKARTRTGDVRNLWPHAPGNSYLKQERGEFLMCQSLAMKDCEILVPGKLPDSGVNLVRPDHGTGRLGDIRQLTHDVISFAIDLDEAITFHAGQFVVVKAPEIEGFRGYSMVNYEEATGRLEFVVKKKPGGAFSEWLFGSSVDGATVEVFGPLGKAAFCPEEDKNILCIAGGSGIAGMMSILSQGCRDNYFSQHTGAVFFGVRTIHDAFFLDELSRFQDKFSENLHITVALSDEDAPAPENTRHPSLDYATGFVHQVASEKMAGAYENVAAFVAGPPPMVDGALRMLIVEARLPAADIRYDKFS